MGSLDNTRLVNIKEDKMPDSPLRLALDCLNDISKQLMPQDEHNPSRIRPNDVQLSFVEEVWIQSRLAEASIQINKARKEIGEIK